MVHAGDGNHTDADGVGDGNHANDVLDDFNSS